MKKKKANEKQKANEKKSELKKTKKTKQSPRRFKPGENGIGGSRLIQ